MGEVRIHLEDQVVAALQRPAKPGQVGLPQARPSPAGAARAPAGRRRHLVGQLPGAVGRIVVHHQHLEPRVLCRIGARRAEGSPARCRSARRRGTLSHWRSAAVAARPAPQCASHGQKRDQADQLAPGVFGRVEVERHLTCARRQRDRDERLVAPKHRRRCPSTRACQSLYQVSLTRRYPVAVCAPVKVTRMLPGFHSLSRARTEVVSGPPARIVRRRNRGRLGKHHDTAHREARIDDGGHQLFLGQLGGCRKHTNIGRHGVPLIEHTDRSVRRRRRPHEPAEARHRLRVRQHQEAHGEQVVQVRVARCCSRRSSRP